MRAAELVRRAQSLGATFVIPESGRLKVRLSRELPPELLNELRQHRSEILALVEGEQRAQDPNPGLDGQVSILAEEIPNLLSWAARAAEEGRVLDAPVRLCETRLRRCAITNLGHYCQVRLQFLAMSRHWRSQGFPGHSAERWQEMERQALADLAALRAALEKTDAATCV